MRGEAGALLKCKYDVEVLHSDTMDQFRTFQMCEISPAVPVQSGKSALFEIPSHRQAMLIGVLARDVLGEKLSKGTEKDSTGIALKSFHGEFDHFKRVFKVVEELKGPLVESIQHHFLLSDTLANMSLCRDYAAVVFFLAAVLRRESYSTCLSRTLPFAVVSSPATGLWEQLCSLVCAPLCGKIQAFNEMEANVKNLSQALVNITSKLTHTKDVKDLFIDLVERFIEPCRSDKWTIGDLRCFLNHFSSRA